MSENFTGINWSTWKDTVTYLPQDAVKNTAILLSLKGCDYRITPSISLKNYKTSEKAKNVLIPFIVKKGALYMIELEKCQGTSTQISVHAEWRRVRELYLNREEEKKASDVTECAAVINLSLSWKLTGSEKYRKKIQHLKLFVQKNQRSFLEIKHTVNIWCIN